MSLNKNDQVMIAIFNTDAEAEKAVEDLEYWDRSRDDFKLGAIGKIYKENGEVKTKAPKKTKGGIALGAVLGIMAGILTGGVGFVAGAAGGGLLGGIAGAFFKKSLHLTPEEIATLGPELDAGKVALVVTCDEYEMKAVDSRLQYAGGAVRAYSVPAEAINEAARAIEEADSIMGLADTDAPSF
jgi:outer membrane lipoprotein SlyB